MTTYVVRVAVAAALAFPRAADCLTDNCGRYDRPKPEDHPLPLLIRTAYCPRTAVTSDLSINIINDLYEKILFDFCAMRGDS